MRKAINYLAEVDGVPVYRRYGETTDNLLPAIVFTAAAVRAESFSAASYTSVYVTDAGGSGGWFRKVAGSTKADDGQTVLVTSGGVRFERTYLTLPVGTETERNALTAANGMLTYQSDATPGFFGRIAGIWRRLLAMTVQSGRERLELVAGANEHQYTGLSAADTNILSYQVSSAAGRHIFRAGTSPATSTDIVEIRGDGKINIGPVTESLAQINVAFLPGQAGLRIQKTDGLQDNWLPFSNGTNYLRGKVVLCDTNEIDMVGVGTSQTTSKLHVNGANGYSQFRLEKTYTPTGSADPNGQIGDICYDDNYQYRKCTTGWKRTALTTF